MAYGKNASRGKYTLKHPHKYDGNPNNVVWRSSWELKLINYLDKNSNVLSWGSEEVVIWYRKTVDNNKPHRYFVDFHATLKMSDESIKKFLFEVKPQMMTVVPELPKSGRKTKSYISTCLEVQTNLDKFAAARKVCKEQGWEFVIMTEKELGIVK